MTFLELIKYLAIFGALSVIIELTFKFIKASVIFTKFITQKEVILEVIFFISFIGILLGILKLLWFLTTFWYAVFAIFLMIIFAEKSYKEMTYLEYLLTVILIFPIFLIWHYFLAGTAIIMISIYSVLIFGIINYTLDNRSIR